MLADDLREIAEWMGQQKWIDHDPEFAACLWARAAILQSIAARLEGRVVVKPAVYHDDDGWAAVTTGRGVEGQISREATIAALQTLLDEEAKEYD